MDCIVESTTHPLQSFSNLESQHTREEATELIVVCLLDLLSLDALIVAQTYPPSTRTNVIIERWTGCIIQSIGFGFIC